MQRLFAAMDGVGYCRCNVCMDRAGRLYLIDCNIMPGIFYPAGQFGGADLSLAQDPDGHHRFLEHLIACALRWAAAGPPPGEQTP